MTKYLLTNPSDTEINCTISADLGTVTIKPGETVEVTQSKADWLMATYQFLSLAVIEQPNKPAAEEVVPPEEKPTKRVHKTKK